VKHGLPPIVWPHATILILGSLPGDESLRKQQYYGNPRNQFWDVLGRVFGEPVGAEYAEKIAWLERHGIALWDVLAAAERRGSLDSDIRNEQANDFAQLFRRLPRLETIALNGSKAALSFERYARAALPRRLAHVRTLALPSTSPVPARVFLSVEAKAERWAAIRGEQGSPMKGAGSRLSPG